MSTAMSLKSTCGCGSSANGGCGCGTNTGTQMEARGTAPAICTDESFHRPRFFPNQLLTHDSLQGLVDYVVGKNRMHNRFLFGDGVVCGLSVTCHHPCESGKVLVAPGYALDCCGNDIAVNCPEELDVKALIRDLRKRQLAGYDCGDPCDKQEDGQESYGLYIVYDETPVDPVAPYQTGEPCGQQDCEPTQICEGYRYELRCDCSGPNKTHVFDRIKACMGDLREAAALISKAQSSEYQANRLVVASQAVSSKKPIAFQAGAAAVMRDNSKALKDLNELEIDKVGDDGKPIAVPKEKSLRLHIANTQQLTGAITRFKALPLHEQETLLQENDELAEAIKKASTTLADAAPRLEFFAPHVLSSNAARIEATEAARLTKVYAINPELDPIEYQSDQAKFVALNTQVSTSQLMAQQSDAAQLKSWLLDKLANSTSLTRCDLYDRLKRIKLDDVPSLESDTVYANSKAVLEIVEILLSYLIDCVCLALNPPCQPCDDNGVLLACLKVKECDVIDICNLSRSFVLSPVALRYWLPPIGAIGKAFEKLCCEFELKLSKPERKPENPQAELIANNAQAMPIHATYAPSISPAQIDGDAARVLREFNIAPEDVGPITAFASNLGKLSLRSATASSDLLSNIDTGIVKRALGNGAKSIMDNQVLEQTVRKTIDTEIKELRDSSVAILDDAITVKLNASIPKIREELESNVTTLLTPAIDNQLAKQMRSAAFRAAVKSDTTVKSLIAENKKLKDELKKVTASIAKLEKGAAQ